MNRALKEELESVLREIGQREGLNDFFEMIADETVAITEEEVLAYISQKNHPALSMPPLF
jgi:acetyl-CoA synthase